MFLQDNCVRALVAYAEHSQMHTLKASVLQLVLDMVEVDRTLADGMVKTMMTRRESHSSSDIFPQGSLDAEETIDNINDSLQLSAGGWGVLRSLKQVISLVFFIKKHAKNLVVSDFFRTFVTDIRLSALPKR